MIKAAGKAGDLPMLVVGLSRENCRRLLEDQPIFFDTKSIDVDAAFLPRLKVLVVGGETEAAIAAELRQHFPWGGDLTAGVSYTAPRELDPRRLRPGDQVLVLPAAPESDAAWVPAWPGLPDPESAGARWLTVAAVLRSSESDVVAVELEDRSALELHDAFDQVLVRIPCEVTR